MSRHHRQLPFDWSMLRHETFARDGYACVLCGSRTRLECDHVVSMADGGTHDLTNLRTLCRSCHIADTRAKHQPHVEGQSEWGEFAAASPAMKRRIRAKL